MHESRRKRGLRLSEKDRTVLDIESKWGSGPSSQEQKFYEAAQSLGLSPGGYSLILRALLDDPAAHAYAPDTIRTLRALRADKAAPG